MQNILSMDANYFFITHVMLVWLLIATPYTLAYLNKVLENQQSLG